MYPPPPPGSCMCRHPHLCSTYYFTLDVVRVVGLVDVEEAFDMLLRQPLACLAAGGGAGAGAQVLFLLDALDEGDPVQEQVGKGGGKGDEGGGGRGTRSR